MHRYTSSNGLASKPGYPLDHVAHYHGDLGSIQTLHRLKLALITTTIGINQTFRYTRHEVKGTNQEREMLLRSLEEMSTIDRPYKLVAHSTSQPTIRRLFFFR